MSNQKRKNGRVELLRFMFAVIILLFHIQKRFGPKSWFFGRGFIGVEFFFLVSGYLLAAGCYSKKNLSTELLGTETAEMIWKKIKNIFPYHCYAMILTILVNGYFLYDSLSDRVHYAVSSWASLFFVQIFGFESTWTNKLTWYLDVWLVVTFIFYIFLRKNYELFVKWACPLIALFILGYMDHTFGRLAGIDDWTGLFYKCFLRGLAEMALGCSAYSLTRSINKINFSKAGHFLLGVLEALGYAVAIFYSCSSVDGHYEFLVLFIMMGALILTFSNVNPGEKFFSGAIYDWFGKMSLVVYLNQFYVIRIVQCIFAESGFWIKTILCVVLTFVCSIICNIIVDAVIKKQLFSNLLIVKEEK